MNRTESKNDNKTKKNVGANSEKKLPNTTDTIQNQTYTENINREKYILERRNTINRNFNLVLFILLFVAILLTTLAFFVQLNSQLVLEIISLVLYGIFFLIWIIKTVISKAFLKRLNK